MTTTTTTYTVSRVPLLAAVEMVYPVVPTKPTDDVYSALRVGLDGDSGSFSVAATDGRAFARVYHAGDDSTFYAVPGNHVLMQARKLLEILREIDSEEVTFEIGENIRVTGGPWVFAFARYKVSARFPEEPGLVSTIASGLDPRGLAAGLGRVEYALGGPGSDVSFRLVSVEHGRVTAYNGEHCQMVPIESDGTQPFPIPAEVVVGLARFLGRVRGEVELAMAEVVITEDRSEPWLAVNSPWACYSFRAPARDPIDTGGLWKYAASQRAKCAVLRVDRQSVLAAARAARIQGDPEVPVLVLDLPRTDDDGLLVTTHSSEGSFELTIDGVLAEGVGDSSGVVGVGVHPLIEMLEGSAEETVALHIFQGKPSRKEGKALLQYLDSSGAHALLPLVPVDS